MTTVKLFEDYPYLTDGVVIIRKMTEDDAEALAVLASEADVYSTLPTFLYELKYEDKLRTIRMMDEECFDTGESVLMGIYLTEDPRCLAGIAEIYNYEEKKGKASIGYRLEKSVWGRGIATRVTALLKEYLISVLGLRTITAHVLHDNLASAKVLKNNGFVNKYPGLLEDWGFDELKLTDKYSFKSEWMNAGSGAADLTDEEKLGKVDVEQFVMAYGIEQDRIRAMLPDGYTSLRPVLRINAEIRNGKMLYLEFNTPVEADGRRGWLNIDNWKSTNDDVSFEKVITGDEGTGSGRRETVHITSPFLKLSYTGTGIQGGCPAENDNEGCYYIGNDLEFRPAEKIEEPREFVDCEFEWTFNPGDAHGRSEGKTIPAYNTPEKTPYAKIELIAENAAAIPCQQVLGAYIVKFIRERR